MLTGLVRSAIRHRGVVIGLALALVVYGAGIVAGARLDVFPEFAPPQVSIQTEAPGFSPEQVEILVTKPLEDAINGVQGIAAVRSQSIQGLSVITAVLAERQDIYRARQSVAERLGEAAGRLPATVQPPVLTPLTSSSSTVLVVGVTSETRSLMEQRTFVDWVMRPRLLATPGVSKVAVFGGEVRQLQIQLDPERLRRYRRRHRRGRGRRPPIDRRARGRRDRRSATSGSPCGPRGRRSPRRRWAALWCASATARCSGWPTWGASSRRPEPRFGEGGVDGRRGPRRRRLGAARRQHESGGARRGAGAGAARARHAGGRPHPRADLFRPSEFIDLALRNITTSLLLGAVLVAVVLLIFLSDVGAAAISLAAIPLSLLAGAHRPRPPRIRHQHPDARRAGHRARRGGGRRDHRRGEHRPAAAREPPVRGAAERRRAWCSMPRSRCAAAWSTPRSSSHSCSSPCSRLRASRARSSGRSPSPTSWPFWRRSLVALTVTPALTLVLLGGRTHRAHESPVLAWLKARYARVPRAAGRPARPRGRARPPWSACGALATLPFFGATFLPEFREGHYLIHMSAVPGTSLDESFRLGARVTAALRRDPRVRSVAQRIGRAELSEDTWGTHYTEFEVDLVPLAGKDAETVQDDLRRILAGFPGVNFAIRGFLAERIEETLTGSTAELVVRVYGDDLDSLDLAAGASPSSWAAFAAPPTCSTIRRPWPRKSPCGSGPRRLPAYGLRADEVLATLETATRGLSVAQTFEGNRATDVVVTLSARAARPAGGPPDPAGHLVRRPPGGAGADRGHRQDHGPLRHRAPGRAAGADRHRQRAGPGCRERHARARG